MDRWISWQEPVFGRWCRINTRLKPAGATAATEPGGKEALHVDLSIRVFFGGEEPRVEELAIGAARVKDVNVQQNPHGYLIGTTRGLVAVPRDALWCIDAARQSPQTVSDLVGDHFDYQQIDILITCLREGLDGPQPLFTHGGEARAILKQLVTLQKTLKEERERTHGQNAEKADR
jgi:hypothetical protein